MAFPSRIPPAMSPGVSGRNLTRHRHVIYSRSKTGFGLAALFIRQQLWGHPVPPTRSLSAMVGGGDVVLHFTKTLHTLEKLRWGLCERAKKFSGFISNFYLPQQMLGFLPRTRKTAGIQHPSRTTFSSALHSLQREVTFQQARTLSSRSSWCFFSTPMKSVVCFCHWLSTLYVPQSV